MIQLTSKHPDFNISTAKEYCRELRTGRVPDFDIDDDLPIHVVSSIDLGVRNRDPPAYVKDPQRKTRRERPAEKDYQMEAGIMDDSQRQ